MAVAINVLFLFVVCAIGLLLYGCLTLPVLLLVTRHLRHCGRWFGAGCLLIVVSYGGLLASYAFWATRPSAVFEMAFGFPPPADVSIQNSSHFILGDSGEETLTFTAGKKTIDRIVRQKFGTSLGQAVPDGGGVYRFSRRFSDAFARETEEFSYDPVTRSANYHWTGVD